MHIILKLRTKEEVEALIRNQMGEIVKSIEDFLQLYWDIVFSESLEI